MENFNFSYDSENDDLFLYLENQKSAGAIELGSFVLDFDKRGNLVAIQIMNASKVLSKLLSKMIEISKLTSAEVEIINFRNMDAIRFRINKEKEINLLIPHIKERSPVLEY